MPHNSEGLKPSLFLSKFVVPNCVFKIEFLLKRIWLAVWACRKKRGFVQEEMKVKKRRSYFYTCSPNTGFKSMYIYFLSEKIIEFVLLHHVLLVTCSDPCFLFIVLFFVYFYSYFLSFSSFSFIFCGVSRRIIAISCRLLSKDKIRSLYAKHVARVRWRQTG